MKKKIYAKFLLLSLLVCLELIVSMPATAQTGCITGCQSNDVQIQKAYLMADLNGTPLTPGCTFGTNVSAYLYLDLTTNTPRVGVSISGKVVNHNSPFNVIASPGQCFPVSLTSTVDAPVTTVKFTTPINWPCGTEIELKDVLIGWGTGNTNFCTSGDAQCPATKSKCWKQGPTNYIPIITFPCNPAVTAGPIDRTKCESDTAKFLVNFTAAANTNVTSVVWQYSTDGGSNWNAVPNSSPYSVSTTGLPAASGSSTLTIDPLAVGLNGNKYRANITSTSSSNLTCNTTPGATLTVNPNLPASVSIAAVPSGAICAGTSVTFTATPTNGGTPSYQWKKNNVDVGTNSATYTASDLVNGDQIKVVMTSTASPCLTGSPATSNTITMVVNPILNASVTIAADPSGPICAGSSVTFTATPTHGGTPSYQWKKNNVNVGTNSATYTASDLANGDQIKVVMTSTASPCLAGSPATSNTITMVVNPNLPASVSIGAVPAGAICANTSVTFTATPTNGGSSPSYQWKKNNADVGTNSATYTASDLVNGDQIKVVMTSNASPCLTGSPATSNVITMTVNPNPTVNAGGALTGICQGGTTTALGGSVGGGATGGTWSDGGAGGTFTPNATTLNATYTAAANAPATITLTLTTSGGSCGTTSANKSLTVKTQPAVPKLIITAQPSICGNSSTGTIAVCNPNPNFAYAVSTNNGESFGTPQSGASISFNVAAGSNPQVKVDNSGCSAIADCEDIVATCPEPGSIVNRTAPITETTTALETSVKAFPNPFSDRIKFMVTSSVSGKGNLDIYNMMGQKVKTVYQGFIAAGSQTFELSLPAQQVANLVYVLRIGDKKMTGKILQINQ